MVCQQNESQRIVISADIFAQVNHFQLPILPWLHLAV
jgi:hypothetical protein